MKRNVIYAGLAMLYLMTLSVLFSSCEHKDLCYQHPHVKTLRVEFDWRDAPDASPKGMCVYFYPTEGGGGQRFDFKGTTGGEVELRVGTYRVMCYNNDTEAVLFHGTDGFDTHGGYTREGNVLEPIYGNGANYAPRAEGTEDERVVITPDMMWGCTATEVEVTDTGISYVCVPESERDAWDGKPVESTEQVITLYPHELVCTYTYEVRNVKNLKHATQMCGSLSGMALSLLFGDESLGTECVTIPFESVSDGVSTITGRFYTFGHHEENTAPHRMTFYVVMDDGKKYAYGTDAGERFNVTGQVHGAPDKRHVHIIIDGLDLPQPIENGSGFDVSVDDWEVVEEDIIM